MLFSLLELCMHCCARDTLLSHDSQELAKSVIRFININIIIKLININNINHIENKLYRKRFISQEPQLHIYYTEISCILYGMSHI